MSSTHICPECGAILPEGTDCQTIFETFLSHDYSDPGYGEVHFLLVGCFMIQHYRYSDEALAWIQPLLRGYVEERITPAELRQQAQQHSKNNVGVSSPLRSPAAPPLPRLAWQMTTADLLAQVQDAASYRQAVRQWVRLTLDQLASSSAENTHQL